MATVQEAVRRLTVQATSTGLDETTGKLNALSGAHRGVAVASQSTDRATVSLEKRLASIQRQYDANFRAEAALTKVTRELAAARAQGLISAQRESELLALATARHGTAAAATSLHSRALVGLSGAAATATTMLRGMLLPMAAVFGPVALMRQFITNTVESENALAQLQARITSTGGAAGLTAGEITKMAGELQKVTAYEDDAIVSAQGLLLSFTNIGSTTFPRATKAMLDLATGMRMELDPAAKLVGKALNDPTKGLSALSRAGITFSDSQQKAIRSMIETNRLSEAQALILAEIERRFGGSAEAARNTLGGALAGLSNSWSNLFEVGDGASRGLVKSINNLTDVMSDSKTVSAAGMIGSIIFDSMTEAARAIREAAYAYDQFRQGNYGEALGIYAGPGAAQRARGREVRVHGLPGLTFGDYTREGGTPSYSPSAGPSGSGSAGPSYSGRAGTAFNAKLASDSVTKLTEEQKRFNEALATSQSLGRDFANGFISDMRNGVTSTEALMNALNRLADRLIQMATDQAINMLFANLFAVAGSSAGGSMAASSVGGLPGIYAKGSVFDRGVDIMPFAKGGVLERMTQSEIVTPFARGGVVSRPTLFPMARGMGLMGEAGPEAVMPLRRGRDGRLGVEMFGRSRRGDSTSIEVSMPVSISAPGADPAQLARVEQSLEKLRADMPETVIKVVRHVNRSGGY